ncbi:unnamed protein product [Withania somnifera]
MGKLLFPSSSLIYFFIFLCVTKLVTSQSPLVTNFCNHNVNDPNFCLKVLGSDPRSKTAKDAHDLEALAIDLGSNLAKTVNDKCSSLLKSETDPNIKAALGSCAGSYSMLILDFKSIKVAFESGRSVGQPGSDARLALSKCDIAFNDKKLTSPLTKDNDDLSNFIQIILANSI